VLSAVIQLSLSNCQVKQSFAGEWTLRVKPQGTLKVVDLGHTSVSVMRNYSEGLVTTDKDNNLIACLAKDWRWADERTIEFRLREDVRFHNGEKFNAKSVKINWEHYKKLEDPRVQAITNLSDETEFEVIDEYTVRFTLPEPDGLALLKFRWFLQAAPAFFEKYEVPEKNWLYLPEAGPYGTGPFKFVEGSLRFGKPSDRVVLKANEDYWDLQYPKVGTIIFDHCCPRTRDFAI